MTEYRLLSVKAQNTYANSWSDSEPYIATYEVKNTRKKYFLFGKLVEKLHTEEQVFQVPNFQISSWLRNMENKIGVWRKR